jgi:hypothetical protein
MNETGVISAVDDADVFDLLGLCDDKIAHRLAEPWVVGRSGNPAGSRPKRLPPPPIIEKLIRLGLTEREVAQIAGVCPQTWSRRKHADPALVEAITRGRAQAKAAFIPAGPHTS